MSVTTSRRLGRNGVIFWLCGALLVVLVPMRPADAISQEEDASCGDKLVIWHFSDDLEPWPSNKKTWAEAGMELWEEPKDHLGDPLSVLVELQGVGTRVMLKDESAGNYGSYSCSGDYIWINKNSSGAYFYHQVARHEMGHRLGAEHSGNDDSMDSLSPNTMHSCLNWSNFPVNNRIVQDDKIQMNWIHNDALSNRQLTANVGFEEEIDDWGSQNGTLSWNSTGGQGGPGHAIFQASGNADTSYIFQTVRVWTGDDSVSYRARINVKRPFSTYSTTTKTALYRKLLYENSSSNSCNYPDGIDNPNNPTVSGAYVLVSQTVLANQTQTSWQARYTPWNPLSNNQGGFEFQVRAYGKSIVPPGITVPIYFDNVRVEGDGG